MSVEPGASGQKFIENSVERIKEIKSKIADRRIILDVDGGINKDTYDKVISAGGEFLVMGSAFYSEKNKKALLCSVDNHYKN